MTHNLRVRCSSILLVLVLFFCAPRPAAAWGSDVHRFIVDRAIDQLPPTIRPFFQKYRAFIVEHAVDPDYWRVAGFADEAPHHFVDLDAYGAYPFKALPREYGQAIREIGPETLVKNGTLPWRAEEMFGRLVRACQGPAGPSLDDVRYLSAVLAHYVADAYVPFHAVLNYDGQLTNQFGIHSRFESELFRRYQPQLSIVPGPLVQVANARDQVFDALLSSFQQVEPILAADRDAIGSRTEYDDAYYQVFFERTKPILESRLSQAITAVASVIESAWEQGGKPALPLETPRRVQKVRKGTR